MPTRNGGPLLLLLLSLFPSRLCPQLARLLSTEDINVRPGATSTIANATEASANQNEFRIWPSEPGPAQSADRTFFFFFPFASAEGRLFASALWPHCSEASPDHIHLKCVQEHVICPFQFPVGQIDPNEAQTEVGLPRISSFAPLHAKQSLTHLTQHRCTFA